MNKEEIMTSNNEVISKARKLQELLKSDGYKIRQQIVERKKTRND